MILAMALLLPSIAAPKPLCSQPASLTVPLPDPVSGRRYEIYISLPPDYEMNPKGTYPLVILADGGRAFPKLACEARELAARGSIEQAVVVGLSYALGEDLQNSRRRDYTPTPLKGSGKAYGGAAAYQRYLRNTVIRYIEDRYRIAADRRIFWGHSYGGLLGAGILLTEPSLFQTYMLGSPSFWFDDGAINGLEDSYAAEHRRLRANVLLYVGGLETARYDSARKGQTRDMVAGMRTFEARLLSRHYDGLRITSTVIENRDHVSSVKPGFEWAIRAALGK
ncbi:MAG: alpha/beta hydrolase-fold protein [Micropruina sp.]|uniref:alpha/beta hydrolase n=1 Tax=Micropruina sp. TaxID=2737536 RepID=UPI0039E703ED